MVRRAFSNNLQNNNKYADSNKVFPRYVLLNLFVHFLKIWVRKLLWKSFFFVLVASENLSYECLFINTPFKSIKSSYLDDQHIENKLGSREGGSAISKISQFICVPIPVYCSEGVISANKNWADGQAHESSNFYRSFSKYRIRIEHCCGRTVQKIKKKQIKNDYSVILACQWIWISSISISSI